MTQENTGTAIAVVQPNGLSFKEIEQWGGMFQKSGMFEDIKSVAAAMVKVKAGDELGIAPFASMSGIHIIKGKASIGAKLQAALVQSSPNARYEVLALDDDKCSLEFFKRGVLDGKWKAVGVSTFTKQDAINAGLAGANGSNKAMYSKYGRNMLFARAMTNGVAWFCPEVLKGNSGSVDVVDDFDAEDVAGRTSQSAEEADRQPEQTARAERPVPAQARPETNEQDAPAFSGPGTDDADAIDGEVVDDEDPLAGLRRQVVEALERVSGSDPEEAEKILKGRVVIKMTKAALTSFLEDLNSM